MCLDLSGPSNLVQLLEFRLDGVKTRANAGFVQPSNLVGVPRVGACVRGRGGARTPARSRMCAFPYPPTGWTGSRSECWCGFPAVQRFVHADQVGRKGAVDVE